ncbi:hypothetical protein SH668x_001298 [Planctomicrobium sp. SH668]|uniref:hypothetical protein n=1 Tax=Planctomicrobium sp. SH668 TaxID=3448126 RepID=UPI003F5B3D37
MKKKPLKKTTTSQDRGGMSLNVKVDEREYFHEAARKAGFTNTSEWMLVLLRTEAERLLNRPSPRLIFTKGQPDERAD